MKGSPPPMPGAASLSCPSCGFSATVEPGIKATVATCPQCRAVFPVSSDNDDRFRCPKCATAQQRTESCVRCGLIFSKYRPTPPPEPVPFSSYQPEDTPHGRELPSDEGLLPLAEAPHADEQKRSGRRSRVSIGRVVISITLGVITAFVLFYAIFIRLNSKLLFAVFFLPLWLCKVLFLDHPSYRDGVTGGELVVLLAGVSSCIGMYAALIYKALSAIGKSRTGND